MARSAFQEPDVTPDIEADIAALRQHVGRSETRRGIITLEAATALAATLDVAPPEEGEPLPPLWHWIYFLPAARRQDLGPDGHPARGGLIPHMPLPRRMWASSRLTYHRDLLVGSEATRTATLTSLELKKGQSGALIFAKVRNEIGDGTGVALVEEQDIVYREAAVPGAPQPPAKAAPAAAQWEQEVQPDTMLLFRYSALTFNAHRIHYDRPYTTGTEGYPGLLVHGPLIATLLAELLRAKIPNFTPTSLNVRAMSPLFDTAPFALCGEPQSDGGALLWARNAAGGLAMEIRAQ